MFAGRYFGPRYFGGRFFGKVGAAAPEPPAVRVPAFPTRTILFSQLVARADAQGDEDALTAGAVTPAIALARRQRELDGHAYTFTSGRKFQGKAYE